jgi:hypothetical protein
MVAAAARCGAAHSVASLAAAGTCYSEKFTAVGIFTDKRYFTKAICAISIISAEHPKLSSRAML